MIKINIPNTFVQERKYVLDIIAKYIGFEYVLNISEGLDNVEFVLDENKLVIKDSFFSKFEDGIEYASENNIPKKLLFAKNEFLPENDLPVIYGNDNLDISESVIVCEIDIVASIFFMLTRWEEQVLSDRDVHNRFPASSSLAHKFKFLHRPIVDEYINFFYNLICKLAYKGDLKHRKFEITLTHDIDYFYKWSSFSKFLKTLAGDIIVRKNVVVFFANISKYFKIFQNKALDPNDTFDYFMNFAEKIGVKTHFFFMTGGLTKKDNHYNINDAKVKERIKQIQQRGHIIGLHPSYDTYQNKNQISIEKQIIEDIIKEKIKYGRQHYLRFEAPATWQIWNDLGFEWDSSIYYSEAMGFRAGACFEYKTFNFLTREELSLKERPLIVMDTTVLNDKKTDWEIHKNKIISLYEIVQKYNGNFVLLWHNSNVNTFESRKIKELFESLL